MQIVISGIPIEVIKKDIKNIHLSVMPPYGDVRVSVPLDVSDKGIEIYLRTKLQWIRTQKKKFEGQERQDKRQFVSGETIYVFGKQYYLKVVYNNRKNNIELSGNTFILSVREESTVKQRENYVNEWYRKILRNEISRLLPKWQEKTGIYCASWQIKYMTTHWGTCNEETSKLWFNLQLAKKTVKCIEYIILHELAHLKVNNHGEKFVAILDEFMPDWRDVKQELNDTVLDFME